MGLLDDAIREHLDLKRRSGGDPAEIERLEREALGRVRRDPSGPPGTATPVLPVAPEYDVDDQVDEPGDVPRAEIVGMPAEPQPKRRGFFHRRTASAASPQPVAGGEQVEPELDRPYDQTSVLDTTEPPPLVAQEHDETSNPAATEPTAPVSPLDDATIEYEAAHGFDDEYHSFEEEPEPADSGDDVLEETPEFLQDTPDHDRLWFEQRPPKDFDFDE